MPPREATGTFPDQFLTFDYDVTMNFVVGVGGGGGGGGPVPPPQAATGGGHDLLPAGAGGVGVGVGVGVGGDNNDDITNISPTGTTATAIQTGHSRPMAAAAAAAAAHSTGGNNGNGDNHDDHDDDHDDHDDDDADAVNGEPIDPLSIDPTAHQSDNNNHNNNHSNINEATPLFANVGTGTAVAAGQQPRNLSDHFNAQLQHDTSTFSTRLRLPLQMPPMNHAAPVVAAAAAAAAAPAAVAIPPQNRQQQHHARAVSISGMSTSSAPTAAATAAASSAAGSATSSSSPTSRLGRHHTRRSSAASSLSSHSQPTRNGSRRSLLGGGLATSAAAVSRSLLDQSMESIPPAAAEDSVTNINGVSLEVDEDGNDPAPPGLDITYDSLATSYLQSPGSWDEDDDEDDEDDDDDDAKMSHSSSPQQQQQQQQIHADSTSPVLVDEDDEQSQTQSSPVSGGSSVAYTYSSSGIIHQTSAFDASADGGAAAGAAASAQEQSSPSGVVSPSTVPTPSSPNSIMLSFGPNTSVSDLKYFAERGCIVALLQALTTPRLVTLGTRMLADYAKQSHRRVAVASNRRILEFVQRTMMQISEQADWLGREYAVETVRSLTATEESDRYLMGTPGLLKTLALVARGGPFVTHVQENGTRVVVPLASEKARLHACIAIMNLSCGKANKIEIAKVPDVLEAMRDVMLHSSDEARLKATTCIKNLSNADANDAALLGTPGLVEALGHVAAITCSPETGATPCTTNACLALMNLSISKVNKHRVFRTPGVMDALMVVLERTTAQGSSNEARIKACSALSNLAIGYDNKIPMFNYPGFVDAILNVVQTDRGEARTKACSILWSFAAEMKNQVPVVQRGDILPVLVRVAEEDGTTEARFKCIAALTLLAESLDNAIPLLESGALAPLMDILHEAGPDPTQWKGQTASWCVGFLMNIAQSDEAVPTLREAGVVELLAPLLTLDHYQSLKAAMAVTFVCRYDEGDECYDLLRKTENVIPKIISLLHNTLSGRGGNGYKYGVFTLRSSVGCISALASGPDFMKERIATGPVFESLLRVLSDFCVDGGTPGAIVGGGRDDVVSATLAVRALQSLTEHLIPVAGSSSLPFGESMEERLLTAFISFEACSNSELKTKTRALATDAKVRIQGSRKAGKTGRQRDGSVDVDMTDVASLASNCCGLDSLPGFGDRFLGALSLPTSIKESTPQVPELAPSSSMVDDSDDASPAPVRTFLLADSRTGRRFAVPCDPSGGRLFNDNRVWCYRRGRFCQPGEQPDPNFAWTENL
eukprot:CAMPEP_0113505444 /NCGR_PEP_ID=MMETSP0014_2-20120614/35321_1 /TAXON_ID=2857 /ORGANISM="Nitzschia sp." /LENGTH=1278 /DNA_ID=CAMNT_0000400759 /DNA_START=399 /DNA_END=4231 /DNA_ORIENTATION=+ /assembly_acc=CAM_ASM_000159